jgi:phosphomannomutase
MNPNSFEAYDIRGHVLDELNEDLARHIGNATAQLLKSVPVILGHAHRRLIKRLPGKITINQVLA